MSVAICELEQPALAVKDRRIHLGLGRRKEPRWTTQEELRLMEMLEKHRSYQEIGRTLRRSAAAVRRRASILGTSILSANGRSLNSVAKFMGVEVHAVMWWASEGWLATHHTEVRVGRHEIRIVEEDDLLAFLESEDYWHLWEPERISDSGVRQWAIEERRGLQFLTTGEVGRILYLTHYAVNLRIRKGWLKAVKRGRNWLVRSDWVGAQPPRTSCKKGPNFSETELAFIRTWWRVRPATWLAEQLGGRSATAVGKAARRMGLPKLGRGYWKRGRRR